MLLQQPTMQDLFAQLGLDNSDEAIENFVEKHRGLNDSRHIEDAPFWNDAQATFLRSALLEDAEWVEIIDQLNAELHH
ncbi:DUF2789 family protein [Alteromonas sp. RKMC-009]|uniref:DUF2789 family protein n=1 Tax=Alteromonas sp. RKMC-009 TaxID=2267264 RepID=UPI000C57A5FC|nr:DUF2789 family protein [Alteromonas sp. RKMC-009]AYA64118.1 DUF2789 domain-containing protein [Alteromonas sp. RKMC-009]MBT80408.1 hypothetical protein [Alteromonadaceae bacterium]MEC7691277.1 DUF2789 family protein [Pseudomonadota bacterium]